VEKKDSVGLIVVWEADGATTVLPMFAQQKLIVMKTMTALDHAIGMDLLLLQCQSLLFQKQLPPKAGIGVVVSKVNAGPIVVWEVDGATTVQPMCAQQNLIVVKMMNV